MRHTFQKNFLVLWFVFAFVVGFAPLSQALDSTSLMSTSVLGTDIEKGAAGGVPVGTVIAWPVASNPPDGSWLECNGQAVNATLYPELRTMMSSVPDYRGMFLRGYGSQAVGGVNYSSVGLGATQQDAVLSQGGAETSLTLQVAIVTGASGAFSAVNRFYDSNSHKYAEVSGSNGPANGIELDMSKLFPRSATENRPVNKTVRYLIRAKS